MIKKLFLGLLICAAAFAFTACSNGSKDDDDKGTRPVINLWYITNNTTTVTADNLNSLSQTPVTTVHAYPNNTQTSSMTDVYKEVVSYTDPDLDVVQIQFSFDGFNTIINDNITQTYEGEFRTYSNQYYLESYFSGNQSTTYSIRVVDSKGNISEPKSFTLHKASSSNP